MILRFKLVEHFSDEAVRDWHFEKHVKKNNPWEFTSLECPTPRALEIMGDKLAKKPSKGSDYNSGDVVGFFSKKHGGCYMKLDKRRGIFASYTPDESYPCGIHLWTCFRCGKENDKESMAERYEELKSQYMKGEIPEGK